MADVKISALPAATTPLAGTEVLPIVQSATTTQVSIANVTAGRAVSASSLTLTTTPLAVASGGTGVTTSTGSGAVVLGTTPTFTTSALFPAGTVSAPGISVSGDTNTGIYFPAADTIGFVEGGAEAMRIDSSRNLLVGGTTSAILAGKITVQYDGAVARGISLDNTSNNTVNAVSCSYNGVYVGGLTSSASATALVTSSDIKLKENIERSESAISSILSIPIEQFDWKIGGHVDYGWVAQKIDKYAPEVVTKGDTWGVEYGRITPRLIKAFQELAAEVAELKAKVA